MKFDKPLKIFDYIINVNTPNWRSHTRLYRQQHHTAFALAFNFTARAAELHQQASRTHPNWQKSNSGRHTHGTLHAFFADHVQGSPRNGFKGIVT